MFTLGYFCEPEARSPLGGQPTAASLRRAGGILRPDLLTAFTPSKYIKYTANIFVGLLPKELYTNSQKIITTGIGPNSVPLLIDAMGFR